MTQQMIDGALSVSAGYRKIKGCDTESDNPSTKLLDLAASFDKLHGGAKVESRFFDGGSVQVLHRQVGLSHPFPRVVDSDDGAEAGRVIVAIDNFLEVVGT